MPCTFGMITAMTRVDAATRATSSPVCPGSTSAALAAGAADARRTGDDVDLVAGVGEGTEISLEVRPWSLVVVGRLRDHVRHQVGFLIDRDAGLVVAVGGRTHVAAG